MRLNASLAVTQRFLWQRQPNDHASCISWHNISRAMCAVRKHTLSGQTPFPDRLFPQTLEDARARHYVTPIRLGLGPRPQIKSFHTHFRALSSAATGSLRCSSQSAHLVSFLLLMLSTRFFSRLLGCLYFPEGSRFLGLLWLLHPHSPARSVNSSELSLTVTSGHPSGTLGLRTLNFPMPWLRYPTSRARWLSFFFSQPLREALPAPHTEVCHDVRYEAVSIFLLVRQQLQRSNQMSAQSLRYCVRFEDLGLVSGSEVVFAAGVIGVSPEMQCLSLLVLSFHHQSFFMCLQALQRRQYPAKYAVALPLPLPLPSIERSLGTTSPAAVSACARQ